MVTVGRRAHNHQGNRLASQDPTCRVPERHDLAPGAQTNRLVHLLLFNQVASRLSVQDDVRACRGALGGDDAPLVAPSFVHAWHIVYQRVLEERCRAEEERRRLARLHAEEKRRERMATTEGRLRWYLKFMGADMVGWREEGEGFRVTWEYDGHTHSARIGRNLRLDSAGICLGHRGQERQQNLSSVVAVIQEARRRHRFDMPRESWTDG